MDQKINPTPEPSSTTDRGRAVENKVEEWLTQKGWFFIARNFRWKGGEIDLILLTPEAVLVFVEVRSSSSISPWLAYSVGLSKRRKIKNTIQNFLLSHPKFKGFSYRFDMIWVVQDKIEHWKNVWD
ncbi:MAG: YraN family protein [Bdellovibrionota bacterium]